MAKMFNRARMTVTSTGTGALSLGVAVAGYQTFSSAGAQNGDSVSYAVEDGLKWEIGTGTYNSVAGTLSRTVTQSFDGTTYGTSPISVTTSAQVFISPLAADLQYGTSAGNLVQLDGSARLPAVDGSLVTALNASNISSGTIAAARVPTLNQNTTGTAANVTGTVAVANGGTGLTSLTAGRIPFGAGTSAFGNSANLTYDGSNLTTISADGYNGLRLTSSSGTLRATGYIDATNGAYLDGINPTNTAYIPLTFNGSIFRLATQGTEKMRIASDGNVGIGTTNPLYKLEVNGGSTSNTSISVIGGGQRVSLNANSGSTGNPVVGTVGNFPFAFQTNSVERMLLDTAGNLGLGVTPSAWPGQSASYYVAQIGKAAFYDAGGGAGRMSFNAYISSVGTNTYIGNGYATRYDQNSGQHVWYNAPNNTSGAGATITFTQAMTLDASGNLGINCTPNGTYAKLDLNGAFRTSSSGTFFTQNSTNFNVGHNGIFLGTVAKNVAPSGGTGVIQIISNDPSASALGGTMALITSATASDRRLQIQCLEQGVAWRNVTLCETAGNVGIGTSSPNTKLDVRGSAAGTNYNALQIDNGANTIGDSVSMTFSSGASVKARIKAAVYGDGYMAFNTDTDVEKMRIDASGNLLVGSTTANAKLYVQNNAASLTCFRADGYSNAKIIIDYAGGGNNYFDADSHYFRSKFGTDWAIIAQALTGTGNRTLYSSPAGFITNSSSDLTLKTNVTPVPYGLSTVMQFLPIKFNWKDTTKMGAQSEIGFGAQDMHEVVPEVVGTNGDGTLSLDYPKLTAVLAKAIQELAAKVQALEAKVA